MTTSKNETRSGNMTLTYWMNRLQSFIDPAEYGNVFVTMNPMKEPEKNTILGVYDYDHPFYNVEVIFLNFLSKRPLQHKIEFM